jgi:hypothetical protein
VFSVPIVRPIRDVDLSSDERRLVTACSFFTDIDGSLVPIILPIPRLRSVRRVERLLFTPGGVKVLVELTAGCLSPVGAEELRVPIVSPIREVLLERAAGCSAPLGTDGLVVLIVLREESIGLPIREVMLGLIRLLVLVVDRFEIEEFDGVVICRPSVLEFGARLVITLLEMLLFGTRLVMARLDMLLLGARLVIALLETLLLGVRLVMALLETLLLGVRLVMALLETLLPGARLVMARLDMLLLGARLVIALLDILLLGARLVIALLETLLLGARLVIALLETLLLGVRLVTLRLDETLLELLEEFALGAAFGAGAGLEACRLCRLELFDLLLDRDVAARTGSAISAKISKKRAKNKGPKVEDSFLSSVFPVWDALRCCILYAVFFFVTNIIRLLSSAFS